MTPEAGNKGDSKVVRNLVIAFLFLVFLMIFLKVLFF